MKWEILSLVIIAVSLCGCIVSPADPPIYDSIEGIVIDSYFIPRDGGNKPRTTVMFNTDTIRTFHNGNASAEYLNFFCKNHINESIRISYRYYLGDYHVEKYQLVKIRL